MNEPVVDALRAEALRAEAERLRAELGNAKSKTNQLFGYITEAELALASLRLIVMKIDGLIDPDVLPVIPAACIRIEDGEARLRCGSCDEPITALAHESALRGLVAAARAHVCPNRREERRA